MRKRVREEANSITANCNIKIFGKLEDPTETKEFFEKTVGTAFVTEVSGFQMSGGTEMGSYFDTQQAGVQNRPRASYDGLRAFREGQAVVTFGEAVVDCAIFYSNPGFAKAMRVTRFMALPQPDEEVMKHANAITKLRDLMVNKTWTAARADVNSETPEEITALLEGFKKGDKPGVEKVEQGICSIVEVHALTNDISDIPAAPDGPPPPPPMAAPPPPPAAPPATKSTPAAGEPPAIFGKPAPEKTDGGKWDKLVDDAIASGTPTPQPESEKSEPKTPSEPPKAVAKKADKPALPKEIQDIIDQAAKKSKAQLFKDSE